jgi:hypothetical protein
MQLKTFPDGSLLEFGKGKFDNWCLFLSKDQMTFTPSDKIYFKAIIKLAGIYGADRIYKDFVKIYDNTTNKIDPHILNTMIDKISREYGKDSTEINVLFSVLYAGMVAEENKVNTILGRKLKRLGLYQCLFEGMQPELAANFSKGKRYMEIERECIARDF